jgi:hypothetical protein
VKNDDEHLLLRLPMANKWVSRELLVSLGNLAHRMLLGCRPGERIYGSWVNRCSRYSWSELFLTFRSPAGRSGTVSCQHIVQLPLKLSRTVHKTIRVKIGEAALLNVSYFSVNVRLSGV